MEDLSATNTPAAALLCNACFNHVNSDDTFCDNCGFPLKGSEQEQNNFIYNRNSKEIDLEDANKKIEKAGNILFWIAGATVLTGFIFYFIQKGTEGAVSLLIVNLILGLIYTALGGWSKKKPMAAIISGFALYVIILLLNAFTDPATIVSGIIIKIFFIGCFIKGIKSAIEAEKIKKELNIE
jgi:hypothetical protein